MLKVVEAFSGIGSQAKALKNIGIEFEVVNTIDWDINAIYAYDILHNGPQDLKEVSILDKETLLDRLSQYSLSANGKEPLKKEALSRYKKEILERIYYAIKRTNNLVNIQEVRAEDLPNNVDLLTYSFPCQDLSISGFWHGNEGGIDRNANNRSSMLWEVERILLEYKSNSKKLPRFLLMENVTAIRSDRHVDNFNEWKRILNEELGYVNVVYDLCAYDFGIPQMRKRTFMLSVHVGDDEVLEENVTRYFFDNNLEKQSQLFDANKMDIKIENFLRMDYSNDQYYNEALISTPNDTPSRHKIYRENPVIYSAKEGRFNFETVRTITTKQDRHPNSGVIEHGLQFDGKIYVGEGVQFRYLTPRECFLFMGFEEEDYQRLVNNNFKTRKNTNFLTRDKLIKLAGNSIVVNVLEGVFKQMIDIDKKFFKSSY